MMTGNIHLRKILIQQANIICTWTYIYSRGVVKTPETIANMSLWVIVLSEFL